MKCQGAKFQETRQQMVVAYNHTGSTSNRTLLSGGVIKGNTATSGNGGGVYYNSPITISSIQITGNHASQAGGGFYPATNSFSFAQTPKIYGNTAGEERKPNNVYIEYYVVYETGQHRAFTIDITGGDALTTDARVGFSVEPPDNTSGPYNAKMQSGQGNATYKNYVGSFFADDPENSYISFNTSDNLLYYYAGNGIGKHTHPGSSTEFTAITNNDFVSDTIGTGGTTYYYLKEPVTLNNTFTVSGQVSLCLNDKAITGPTDGTPIFNVPANSKLTIYNHEGGFDADGNYNFEDLTTAGDIKIAKGGKVLVVCNMDGDESEFINSEKDCVVIVKPNGDIVEKHEHNGQNFTDKNTLESPLQAGSYYLTDAVSLNDTVEITSTVDLCLNGKTITGPADDEPAFSVPNGSVLNIRNCVGNDSFAGLANSGGIKIEAGGKVQVGSANSYTAQKECVVMIYADGTISEKHSHALNVGYDSSVTVGNTSITFENKLTVNTDGKLCANGVPLEPTTGTGTNMWSYKLTKNSYLGEDIEINNPITLDANVSLCLNGHVIKYVKNNSNDNYSFFVLSGSRTLDLCDCNPGTEHTISGVTINGGVITGGASETGGAVQITNYGTLNMYGGTIAFNNARQGAGMFLGSHGTVNMYGGTVGHNTASTSDNAGAFGGGVCIASDGKFNLSGGEITGNIADDGGGIKVNTGGQLTFNSGKINNNRAGANGAGAGIYNNGSIFMNGGEIKGNKVAGVPAIGAGVWNGGQFNMRGGVITGNESDGNGAGVFLVKNDTAVFNVSGNSQIYGNFKNGNPDNICVYNNQKITVGNLASDANINVNRDVANYGSQISVVNADYGKYLDYFHADDSEHYHVAWNEAGNYLELVAGPTVESHKHGDVVFTALPDDYKSLAAGNYYLTGNITDTVTISGTVNLCLNGNTFTDLTDKPAFKVPANGVLNLFDCQPDVFAKLAATGGIEVATGGKVVIKNKDDKTAEYTATKNGVVKVEAGGTITLPQDVSTDHIHNGNVYTPTSTISNPLGAGYYYLTQDINLSQTITVTSGAAYICLNGYKITGPASGPAFEVANGATLNLANDEGKAEDNTDGFKGLAGSGGIEVAGGGTLNMIAKDPANNVNYAPAAGTAGGKVTVDNSGVVDKPSDGPHSVRHPELAEATVINEGNFNTVTQEYSPAIHTGTLPDNKMAYRYLTGGQYYLEGNFTMPNALVVLNKTDFCLNGSNLGADNDTWIYEMQHIFWVPEKAVLNVLDCQRNLEIVWLYGGRVFLKNGGKVNISGKIPDYITTIEMDDKSEGEVKVENNAQKKPIMTLPEGATLTQKKNNTPTQTIKNNDGVLEISTPTAEAPTQITPPADKTVDLRLEEPAADEEAPNIVLEAPAKTTVQTEDGPEITLEQPGEVAADGTVTAPEVTVADEEEHTIVKITATENQDIKVDTKGEAQAPAGSTVTVDHVIIKIEAVGGTEPDNAATVSPSGDVQLPAGNGSEVTISDPSKGNASITIALPNEGGEIGFTDSGVTLPADSKVEVKNKENVKIVIALPNLEGNEQPSIDFGNGGTLILPPGTKVTVDGKETEVDKDNPVFNPDTGELTDKEPENPDRPTEPVHPNNPPDDAQVVTPEQPVETPEAKVEVDDQGEITITPKDPEKPPVVITPQKPTDPDKPGETPKPPVVDETGKVFIDEPFKVETEDGPDITAEKGGSVDPDGNVTSEKVTVEQKNPDGTKKETTLTAPEGDAVKVGPDGEAQAPVGTEVENEDVTVKIDKVPDPTKPVPVKPDGSIDLPGGSEITVTPENPQQPEQNYTVKLPEQGGEVKLNKDKDDNVTITLPPGTKVVDQNGKETTISNNGGTLNLSTGDITGGLPNGGNSGGSGGGGSSSASYVITASASIGGEISPDKRVVVSRGADQTFTIKPNEGYVLSDVLVDSKSVGPVTSYTFENVRSGHSIQALFVAEGMAGHGHQGDCPKDETCPIWPYTDSIPTAWYHDGVHYCIEKSLMIGTAPKEWETNIPLSRAMMAQVLYNKAGRPAVSGEGVFDDVDQEWYWPAITWGGRNDVLWGYGDGNYGPQDPITREQLATLLWRFAGQPQTSEQLSFSDAAEASDYAKQALSWASQHGVITGYPDGTFRPQDNTSRAEAAQMIMRYFNL